jgi:hypothetical protein
VRALREPEVSRAHVHACSRRARADCVRTLVQECVHAACARSHACLHAFEKRLTGVPGGHSACSLVNTLIGEVKRRTSLQARRNLAAVHAPAAYSRPVRATRLRAMRSVQEVKHVQMWGSDERRMCGCQHVSMLDGF